MPTSRENDRLSKILFYLKKNTEKGYPLESLRIALLGQGYTRTDVQKAVEELHKQKAKEFESSEKLSIKYELLDENDNVVLSQENKKSFWKKLMFWK